MSVPINIQYLFATFLFTEVLGATELLKNGDFESASFAGNWKRGDCVLTRYSEDKVHGHYSVKVTNRHHDWSGPQQEVSLTGNHYYKAHAHFKLLNIPSGTPYVLVELMAGVHGNGKTAYRTIAQMQMQQVKFGWTEISGDFFAPDGTSGVKFYIQVHNSAVNYLMDNSSLQQIQHNSNWKTEALNRINTIRKAPVTLRLASGSSAHGLSIELVQQRREFGFGTAVYANMMTDPGQSTYQNFIYKNFEWAVISNSLKWRLMEWSKGHINFARPVNAIKAMQSHGLKLRGHCMFWGVDGHAPKWLEGRTPSEYVNEMKLHVREVIAHTKGTLEHWDVQNENQHGDYFERHTKDPDITSKMFQWVHTEEPGVKLFLNEYNTVTSSQSTAGFLNQGLQMKRNGIPIYGLGVQSHFHTSDIDMDVVKYRLDKVAEAGLKIWITELTITENDANKKAVALENVLTLYFSHPAVEGVMLWGFWDGAIHVRQNSLFTGSSIAPNAAGQKYLDLVQGSWKTHFNHNLEAGATVKTTAFKGDYVLNIKKNGHTIHTEKFTVGDGGKDLTVHLSGDHQVSHVAFG